MAKIVHGILQNVTFSNVGSGKYVTENTIYVNQSDMAGNGTGDIQPGYLVFAPLMDPGTGTLIPGAFERYKVTSSTPIDISTVILELDYDGDGLEEAPPANGVDCVISQPTPNLGYGLAVSEQLYPTLAAGMSVGTFNQDLLKIADKGSTSGGGGNGVSALTSWAEYFPVFTNVVLGSGSSRWRYRRVGDSIEIRGMLTLGTGGGFTGQIGFSIPPGLAIDFTKMASDGWTAIGIAQGFDTAGGKDALSGTVFVHSNENTLFIESKKEDGTAGSWGTNFPFTWSTGDYFSVVHLTVPIQGWSVNISTVQDSQEYVFNSSSSPLDDLVSFQSGISGIEVSSFNPGPTGSVTKRVEFSNSLKDSDILQLELYHPSVALWRSAEQMGMVYSVSQDGNTIAGISLSKVSNTQVDVKFWSKPRQGTQTWADYAGSLKWRLRKISSGNYAEVQKGDPGKSFYTVNGVPASSLGSDGDSALNFANGDLYLKGSGAWSLVGNLGTGGSGTGLPDTTGNTGKFLFASPTPQWRTIQYSDVRPKFEVISFTPDMTYAEIGQLVEFPTFSLQLSETPAVTKLIDSGGESIVTIFNNSVTSPNTYQLDTPGEIAFTLEISDSQNLKATKACKIVWLPKIYFGTGILNGSPETFVSNLSSEVKSSSLGSYVVNAQTNEYIYFALPSSYPIPTFSVNGFQGGFTKVANNLQVLNTSGLVLSYDLYRSENHSLGLTTMVIS